MFFLSDVLRRCFTENKCSADIIESKLNILENCNETENFDLLSLDEQFKVLSLQDSYK